MDSVADAISDCDGFRSRFDPARTGTANSDCDGFADTIKRIPSQRSIVKRFFQGFQRFAKRTRRVRLFRHT